MKWLLQTAISWCVTLLLCVTMLSALHDMYLTPRIVQLDDATTGIILAVGVVLVLGWLRFWRRRQALRRALPPSPTSTKRRIG